MKVFSFYPTKLYISGNWEYRSKEYKLAIGEKATSCGSNGNYNEKVVPNQQKLIFLIILINSVNNVKPF